MGDSEDLLCRISELQAEAPNEQVEQLLLVIEELGKRTSRLEERNERLNRRIRSLEKFTGLHDEIDVESIMAPKFDHRDKAVLQSLKGRNPEQVTLRDLQDLYKKRTDVRGQDTLRERVKLLIEHGPFEGKRSPWEFTAHVSENG